MPNKDVLDISSIYDIVEDMIKKSNEEAKKFCYVTRLENKKYSNWNIERKITRKLFHNNKTYEYILYMYYDKETKKRFTYYHNEFTKSLRNKNYLLNEILANGITRNLIRNKHINNIANNYKIPYYIWYYWREKFDWNFTMKNHNFFIDKTIKNVQLDIDDAYKKIRTKNGVETVRFRMVTFSTFDPKNLSKIANKTSVIQCSEISNLSLEKQHVLDIKLLDKINEIKDNYYNNLNVLVSGDGAKNITQIATKIGAKRHYDLFHFLKIAFENFGYSSRKNRINKDIYGDIIGNPFTIFRTILLSKKYDEIDDFIVQCQDILKMKKASKTKVWQLINIRKLWKLNKEFIINSIEKNGYNSGNAETFVGHDLKRFGNKKFGIFSLKSLTLELFFNKNLENNLIII